MTTTVLFEITSSGNADLILHPVTLALLRVKWEGFARLDVASQLVTYLLFLAGWIWSTQVREERMMVTLSIATQALALLHVFAAFGLPFDPYRRSKTAKKNVQPGAPSPRMEHALSTVSRRHRRCNNLLGRSCCQPLASLRRLPRSIVLKLSKYTFDEAVEGIILVCFVSTILLAPALTIYIALSSIDTKIADRIREVQSWLNLFLWWRIFQICSAVRYLGIIQRTMTLMYAVVIR
jgi:hypothetical protein